MATIVSRPGTAGETTAGRRPHIMLGMATVGFALTFWAWALLSPLGAHFKQALGLSSFQQALIVAMPSMMYGRRPAVVAPAVPGRLTIVAMAYPSPRRRQAADRRQHVSYRFARRGGGR